MSAKHTELSEQLANWWRTQTDFKTKKALAGFLKVHPDTVGEYFSGKSFPRWDIANKLFDLTNIQCLKPADVSTAPGPLEEEYLSGKNPEAIAQEVLGSGETKEITFKCRYCGKDKPLEDMRTLTRFFPPVVACRDCERKMR